MTVDNFHTTFVTLSWSPPLDNGNRIDTEYRISCDSCGSSVTTNSGTLTFRDTFVTIKNLYPETSYRFVVYSQNGVSSVSKEEPKFAEITVVTKESNPVLSKRVEELEQELEGLKKIVNELRLKLSN